MLKEAFQIMKTGHTSTLKTILVEYHDCNLERNGTRGKELTCQRRRSKRFRFEPWVRKIPGEGNGNPFQYSFLENSMDRGAWWATFHRVSKIQT